MKNKSSLWAVILLLLSIVVLSSFMSQNAPPKVAPAKTDPLKETVYSNQLTVRTSDGDLMLFKYRATKSTEERIVKMIITHAKAIKAGTALSTCGCQLITPSDGSGMCYMFCVDDCNGCYGMKGPFDCCAAPQAPC